MSRHRDWDPNCKVYVGNLGNHADKYELEDCFGKYGPLKNVWVARNPPGFAFIEFEDTRDAEDAVKGLDGTRVCGVSGGLSIILSRLVLLTLFLTFLEPRSRGDVKRRRRRRRTWRRTRRKIWRPRSRPRQEEEPLQVSQPRS